MAKKRWIELLSASSTGLLAGGMVGLIVLDLDLAAVASFWGDASPVVPACAVGFAVGWRSRARRLLAAGTGVAALLWLAVALTPLVDWLASDLVREDRLSSADAVFVFGSRLQDDGEPTGAAATRLLRAVELLAERRTARLVVSECVGCQPYAPLARAWVARFVPGAEVLVVGPIRNSRDEAVALAALARQRGWRRALAVTTPLHTRRACAAIEREGLEVVCVAAVETRYDLETLSRSTDRRAAFAPALHERLGLWLYRRRGWIGRGVPTWR